MARTKFLFIEPYFRPGSPLAQQTKFLIENLKDNQKALVNYRGPLNLSQFKDELTQWSTDPSKRHKVLLLSAHGEPGKIFVGDYSVTLNKLAKIIDGNALGRHIHFFSCLTLGVRKSEIYSFIKDVRCFSVSGYAHPVGIYNGTPVELMVAEHLVRFSSTKAWRDSVNKAFHKFEDRACRSTGFRLFFRDEC
jgi:hypothetical protein